MVGLLLLLGAAASWAELATRHRVLDVALVFVLCADGLLNLAPGAFGHFKERMQDAWVRRHGDSARAGDTHLFGTVNALLGLLSVAAAAAVLLCEPVPAAWVAASLAASGVLMALLVGACARETRGSR